MIKNIIQTLFTKGFVAGINFLILIVSAKYLGVNTRGEIGLFILNIAIIQIINEVYTGFSLVYFVPKFNLRKLFIYGLVWTFLAVAISNLILYLLGEEIRGFEMDMLFLSAIIILHTFNLVIILAKENIRLFNFLSLLQPLLLLSGLAYFTLIAHDYTFKAYIIPLYISFSVVFIISLPKVIGYISKDSIQHGFSLRKIFENGFFCQLAVLMHQLSNRFSFYVLGSITLVGLYSTATTLIESVLVIANGITPIVLSRISNTGDTDFSKGITLTLAKISLILSCVAALIIWLLPNSVFIYLLGNDFFATKDLMLWIAPGVLLVSFSTIISHYFSGLGNLRIIALCNGGGFLVTVILAPILIAKYELKGAAITANISYFVSFLLLSISFFVKAKFKFSSLFNLTQDVSNLKKMI